MKTRGERDEEKKLILTLMTKKGCQVPGCNGTGNTDPSRFSHRSVNNCPRAKKFLSEN